MALPMRNPDPRDDRDGSRKSRSEPGNAPDNRIYVLPPWAVPAKKRSGLKLWLEGVSESRFAELVRLEVKVLLLVAVFAGLGYVGLKGLYRTKSQSGVNVAEPLHAPNLFPFLR
jgi:hypothetical protein